MKEGLCYVCLDGHRSDDDKPYLFVTEDYGQTWKSITNNLPAFGSTRTLRAPSPATSRSAGSRFNSSIQPGSGAAAPVCQPP